MKVVKKTGLVPVHTKFDKKAFGVPPTVALKGVQDGTLFLVDIPEDVETIEFHDTSKPAIVEKAEEPEVIAIPEDWESLHFIKVINLAKQLIGDDLPVIEDKKPAEVAKDIIREEIARRAAGNPETPDDPALTA